MIHVDYAKEPGEYGECPVMVAENADCPDCGRKHDIEKCPKCGSHIFIGFGLFGGGYGPYKVCMSETCDWQWKRCLEDDEA